MIAASRHPSYLSQGSCLSFDDGQPHSGGGTSENCSKLNAQCHQDTDGEKLGGMSDRVLNALVHVSTHFIDV